MLYISFRTWCSGRTRATWVIHYGHKSGGACMFSATSKIFDRSGPHGTIYLVRTNWLNACKSCGLLTSPIPPSFAYISSFFFRQQASERLIFTKPWRFSCLRVSFISWQGWDIPVGLSVQRLSGGTVLD